MQPRKSRALIITFIITLVLLIVGYFLFVKSGVLKGNSSILGKKFDPTLGTPAKKDLLVGQDNPDTPQTKPGDNTTTPPATKPGGGNTGGGGSGGTPPQTQGYVPPNMSFPQPNNAIYRPNDYTFTTQCNDGIDNDKDGSADSADNDCHSDGDAKNASSYVSTYGYESGSQNTIITPDPIDNKKVISCNIDEIPLVFTAEEQARLDELTRQFYRLSPQLKTENDVVGEISSEQGYQDIINNADNLEKECRAQTSTDGYLRNDIDRKILPPNPSGRSLLIGFSPDHLGAEAAKKTLGIDDMATVNCFNNPGLCFAVYWTYEGAAASDVLESTIEKGRRERLRNPYYDSSREQYPFDETASYVIQYFTDPRHREVMFSHFFKDVNGNRNVFNSNPPTAASPYVWIYRENEQSWMVW